MEVKKVHFPELADEGHGLQISEKTLSEIPLEVTVELGHSKLNLKDLVELSEGSIIELDRLAGEPLDLKVGGQLVAQGEVVAVDDKYGLRITNILLNK
ncbi:MAG: flagellar motor switch protein FliN/FliY [Candidatus Saganbacteria bacterium]|uniref:Flagellar motor switch protein FliN/FliY n=1 Tax=Candidatus Saganbacteria bacterium TaxID=2575572 RepID=A0A833NZK5_UNCSA|nr:MAG: flagellar motor switch protein FliN/FliY [Candidatus Saganbacteria bacterium]